MQHHSPKKYRWELFNHPNTIHSLFTFWRQSLCDWTSLENAVYWKRYTISCYKWNVKLKFAYKSY